MRLRQLRANHKSFRTIEFNESGLSIILGKQKNREVKNKGLTYNGVGKTLALALTDYCLASNKRPALERALPGWEFYLDLEHDGQHLTLGRSTSKPTKVSWNGNALTGREARQRLMKMVFDAPEDVEGVSFRSLIGPFLRVSRSAYNECLLANTQEQPYTALARNVLLLGLDVNLVNKKRKFKKNWDSTKERATALFNDPVFVEWATNGLDVQVALRDLSDKIGELERALTAFRVAANYTQLKEEADALRGVVQDLRNRVHLGRGREKAINRSLALKADLELAEVVAVFEQAAVTFPDSVRHTLEEVMAFHKDLRQKRRNRLLKDRQMLRTQIESEEEELRKKSAVLDDLTAVLGSTGALEEYRDVSRRLSQLRVDQSKLQEYRQLQHRYAREEAKARLKLTQANLDAAEYLENMEEHLNSLMSEFRQFSAQLYPDKPGGLSVSHNAGDNQTQFNIAVHIQDDASDGINEAKIFCYDMLLLKSGRNHNIEFIWHDSRLFSDIDPRQRAVLLRMAMLDVGRDQYVVSLNEDQLEAIRPYLTAEEFEGLVNSIVLELTDDAPESKLLGVEVDMKYTAN